MSQKMKSSAEIYLDLDGPILDVKKRNYSVYRKLILDLGGKPLSEDRYWKNKRQKESVGQILKNSALNDKIGIFKKEWFRLIEKREFLKEDRLLPGIRQLLARLSKEHPLILVSLRRSKQDLLWQLNRLGIKRYFYKILSKNYNEGDWRVKYNLIKKEKPVRNSFVVGDTEIDILSGKKLKLKTIALSCGIRNRQFLKRLKPDYLVNDLKGALRVVRHA